MKLQKLAGATSEIWQVFIRDSTSTTGGGLTGLAFNTASFTAYYHRDTDTTATAITLATMTVGTFTSSGFKEIDATNMPGWYQFCPPNAAIASGAKNCGFHLKGAANMVPLPIEVQLTAVNPDSATAFVTSVATVTTVTNQLTAAAIATGVWQDTTAGDFTVSSSIGKSLYTSGVVPGGTNGLLIAGANANTTFNNLTVTSVFTINGNSMVSQSGDGYAIVSHVTYGNSALKTLIDTIDDFVDTEVAAIKAKTDNLPASFPSNFASLGINSSGHISRVTLADTVTTVTNQLTAAAIATGVWQDATAGDFTTSGSIGKSLFTSGAVPGAAGGLFIAGSNAATTMASFTVTAAMSVGAGLTIINASGTALSVISAGGNGNGVSFIGNGSGKGFQISAGATGTGLAIFGGGTSGDALTSTATDGNAATLTGGGTTHHGLELTRGGSSGDDLHLENADCNLFPRTTWYVATTGNDASLGTKDAPFLTLAGAVSAASINDTIKVKAGTYSALQTINKNGLTIEGDGDSTLFTYSATGDVFTVTADHVTLKDFKITSPNLSAGIPSTGINITGTTWFTAEGLTIDGQDDGIYATVLIGAGAQEVKILDCIITATQHAVAVHNCRNLLIDGCVLRHQNTTNGDYGAIGLHYACWLNGSSGKINNSYLHSFPTTSALGGPTGVVGVNGVSGSELAHIAIVDSFLTLFYAGTNASNYAIAAVTQDRSVSAVKAHVTLERTSIVRLGATAVASGLDIDMSFGDSAGSSAKSINCNIDKSKVSGTYVTLIDGQVTDTLEDTGTTLPDTLDALPTAAENAAALLAATLAHGGTVERAMEAAQALGFGKLVIDNSAKTMKLYAPNNTTLLVTHALAPSAEAPITRTPQ